MKALFSAIITSVLLSGCITSMETVTQKEPDENLIGFYINSKNGLNHIYVIGERNEYLFYENKAFSAFLKSNHLNHTVFTNADISYSASNSALIDYNVYLDAQKSGYSDLKRFENLNSDVNVSQPKTPKPVLLTQIKQSHPDWHEGNEIIEVRFRSRGQLINLNNRNGLLAQHALKTPIKATVSSSHSREKVHIGKSLGAAALMPVFVVASPLTCFNKNDSFAESFVDLCPFR